MYRMVMVPTDGSELSRHAIPLALAVARPANAVVHLVAVLEPAFEAPVYGAPDAAAGVMGGTFAGRAVATDLHASRGQAQETALQMYAERLATDAHVQVTAAMLTEGDVVRTLTRHAAARGADLIVIATHGRGGLGRAVLGSVADALVRSAPCPVLLARTRGTLAHEYEPTAIGHLLVPIDSTRESEGIVPHAATVATLTGARCTLMYVSHPQTLAGIAAPDALLDPAALQQSEEADRARLERLAERFRTSSVRVNTVVVRVNDPAEAIVDFAATHGVNLIALTTRAEHGLARLMHGSTAATLLHKTLLPLLLARLDAPSPM